MKDWWVKTAWPWLKENWWAVLALPLALIVVIAMVVHGLMRGRVSIVDPLQKADDRSQEEALIREREMEEEIARLKTEKQEIQRRYDELEKKIEKHLEDQVEELRDDPEKLRRIMLGINR